ncbi:MAG: response regulator transcription factor [Candidatus Paceibacterota bacterium]|jgi:DNA-binding response OmpR family regulator
MKILIVEDDNDLCGLIKKGLKQEGYAVDCLSDGKAALTRIHMNHRDYDLIVLDLGLPGKSGYEICGSAREAGIQTPILILTAKHELDSKVKLLNIGADDYLTKPFELKELLARIRAITRRPKEKLPEKLKLRDLILNPSTQKVTRAGKELKLSLKEFRLLEYLMRRPNKAVSRQDLLDNVWDSDFDSMSNVLDVFIKKLRDKVDKGRGPKLIETVWGVGYRLKD